MKTINVSHLSSEVLKSLITTNITWCNQVHLGILMLIEGVSVISREIPLNKGKLASLSQLRLSYKKVKIR